MANLITDQELATWAQVDLTTVQGDAFAQEVLEKSSNLVRDIAQQPTWEIGGDNPAPFRARLLVLKVARRTYVNPDQEIASTTGPISSRVADEAAMALSLSDEEVAYLQGLAPGADASDGLWIMRNTGGVGYDRVAYIADDQQVNLGDLYPWGIPYGDYLDSDFFAEPDDWVVP